MRISQRGAGAVLATILGALLLGSPAHADTNVGNHGLLSTSGVGALPLQGCAQSPIGGLLGIPLPVQSPTSVHDCVAI